MTGHGSRLTDVTPGPASGVTVAETESNNASGTADPIVVGDDYTGTINPGGESDFLSFPGTAGQTIIATISLSTLSDSTLRLLDTNGTTDLAFNDDFPGLGLASQISFALPTDGTYFLQVQSFAGSSSGTYTLQLRTLLGAETTLVNGWLYIQKALENLAPVVTRSGNDGSVAVLGSADSTATFGNAGAAYHFAVPNAAATTSLTGTVTFHDGAPAINQFFTNLGNGTVNPAIIVTAGEGANNDLVLSEGVALTNNALAIANFVNSGGGLLSHGFDGNTDGPIAYGWLTALIPGASFPSGCEVDTLSLTLLGQLAFPGLTNSNIRSGPCHSHFVDHGLPVLARDAVGATGGRDVIIGGSNVGLPGQIAMTPEVDINPPGTDHMVTANVVDLAGTPLPGKSVTFDVLSGPNIDTMGTVITDTNGDASFMYTSNDGVGLDVIQASFVDATGNTVVNTARKYWDLDCQPNSIPDTCDLSCTAFNNTCAADFPGCGGSEDINNDLAPDECNNPPPVAQCQDVTVLADGSCQSDADVNNGSSDPDGHPITMVQAPPGPYGLGSTDVSLTVTNDKGASDSCMATVTIVDETSPSISCPSPLVLECTGSSEATASFSASATDNCSEVTPTCNAASSSTFSIGSSGVSCRAMDTAGNSSYCGFSVTVIDTTVPTVSCIESVNPSGKKVPKAKKQNEDGFYLVFATDICTREPTITLGGIRLYNGETIKITQRPGKSGVRLVNRMGRLNIKHFQVGPGDAMITATDGSGNTKNVTCLVPPPPK